MALEHIGAKSRRGRASIPGSLRVSRSQLGFGRAESQRKHGASYSRRPYCRRSLNAERPGCAARPNGCKQLRTDRTTRSTPAIYGMPSCVPVSQFATTGFSSTPPAITSRAASFPRYITRLRHIPSSRLRPMPHWRPTPTPISEVSTTTFPIIIAIKSGSASSMRTTPAADCPRSPRAAHARSHWKFRHRNGHGQYSGVDAGR